MSRKSTPSTKHIGPNFAGSALLLTLWCVGILSLSIFVVVRLVEYDLDDERFESMRVEAREMALTGIALGLHPGIERGDPLLRQTLGENRTLVVSVESENARLNINLALEQPSSPILKAILTRWELPDRDISSIVDSLYDWVDQDDLRSLNGAEIEDLQDQSRYSIPQNRPFIAVSEMERVRGMDQVAAQVPQWRKYFSVFSGDKFDIHDVSLDWLVAAGRLPEPVAAQWIEARTGPDKLAGTEDDLRLSNIAELRSLLGIGETQLAALQELFDVNADPLRITSLATIGDVSYAISVVTTKSEAGEPPQFMSWEEE
jgi:hypothetical protein